MITAIVPIVKTREDIVFIVVSIKFLTIAVREISPCKRTEVVVPAKFKIIGAGAVRIVTQIFVAIVGGHACKAGIIYKRLLVCTCLLCSMLESGREIEILTKQVEIDV